MQMVGAFTPGHGTVVVVVETYGVVFGARTAIQQRQGRRSFSMNPTVVYFCVGNFVDVAFESSSFISRCALFGKEYRCVRAM